MPERGCGSVCIPISHLWVGVVVRAGSSRAVPGGDDDFEYRSSRPIVFGNRSTRTLLYRSAYNSISEIHSLIVCRAIRTRDRYSGIGRYRGSIVHCRRWAGQKKNVGGFGGLRRFDVTFIIFNRRITVFAPRMAAPSVYTTTYILMQLRLYSNAYSAQSILSQRDSRSTVRTYYVHSYIMCVRGMSSLSNAHVAPLG